MQSKKQHTVFHVEQTKDRVPQRERRRVSRETVKLPVQESDHR